MKKKVLIVVSDYYEDIANALLDSTKKFLNKKIKFNIIKVPGVFEIPIIISKNINKFDGFVAIGCVIKGKTAHFDLISKSVIDAIMNLSIDSKKPVGNCILTCFNYKQALARKKKGREAAIALNSILYK
jgi:6,7-dimethyl-8-ribityllumazine synthase|tara:strand:- start:184 stop:570 length:387 start_codon:yes stop_codon:yes gene_type:complete